ncbi:hypothetical protein GCM10010985_20500 [Caballeronia grimmiae]|uniref:Uncharacterized protein n=1 Tax=Caballeronia grimmiae TaxID=1071679 RepID=A0ABQ1RFR4_9BURK|nr:hypothetical protein GCM10010985_20500 [Caballeronia grimmiae]
MVEDVQKVAERRVVAMFFAFACDLGDVSRQWSIRAEHTQPEEPDVQPSILQPSVRHFAWREDEAWTLADAKRLARRQLCSADGFPVRVRADAAQQRVEPVTPRLGLQAFSLQCR